MYISQNWIEAISQGYIKEYFSDPEIQHRPYYRIDPVVLAERILRIDVQYKRLSPDKSVLGATAFEKMSIIYNDTEGKEMLRVDIPENSIMIEESLLSEEMNKGRHNFTAAHEAGHIILKREFPDKYCSGGAMPHFFRESCLAYTDKETMSQEWQANAIASALLMPKDLVSKFFEDFSVTKPLRIYQGRRLLLREKRILRSFSQMFEVSETAALIRLSQLGFTKACSYEQYLNDYDFDILTGGRI